ncbi:MULTISPECIES: response regulator transcription factor [unclassified Enterococcus]|uniref:response regulator transcription factor n=1 Tax=unclassified Enterococcus TaxID=2608891 RepID=UPI001CE17DAE|nr:MULTISPECIES: response regulator transcription factor [unclassified Enterococcus]MCA5013131.1 response regulator transcription factor [Enterococcus sp. S23]MCA5016381.1 response regulator transcription factor [Enterococcus sp. S22(2020)]
MKKILIVDDHQQITEVLKAYVLKEGFTPVVVSNGQEALNAFYEHTIELILLDVMLPVLDGFEVCKKIRETSNVPIIMITAKGEDYHRIMGLDIGADDYIVKPFSPSEVMARIRAILRRIERTEENQQSMAYLTYDNLALYLDEKKVTIDQKEILLTKRELELLWLLLSHREKVFSRDNLLDSLWGIDYYGDARTVDTHIKRLRAKLDEVPHPQWEIATVWGQGYKFEGKNEK